ncbi:hypothetical protein CLOP_g6085 [Closterium sp. NIES-67]|nr:hypothetical protein CLOP_g6085 [Closterium sp. NIES-67]
MPAKDRKSSLPPNWSARLLPITASPVSTAHSRVPTSKPAQRASSETSQRAPPPRARQFSPLSASPANGGNENAHVWLPLRLGMGPGGMGGISWQHVTLHVVQVAVGCATGIGRSYMHDHAHCRQRRASAGRLHRPSPSSSLQASASSSLLESSASSSVSGSAVARLLQTGNAAALLLLCQALFPTSFSLATPTLALLHLLSSSRLLSPLSRILSPLSRVLAPLSRLLSLCPLLRPRLGSSRGGRKGEGSLCGGGGGMREHTLVCLGASLPIAVEYERVRVRVGKAPAGACGREGEEAWRRAHRRAASRVAKLIKTYHDIPQAGGLLDLTEAATLLHYRTNSAAPYIMPAPDLPPSLVAAAVAGPALPLLSPFLPSPHPWPSSYNLVTFSLPLSSPSPSHQVESKGVEKGVVGKVVGPGEREIEEEKSEKGEFMSNSNNGSNGSISISSSSSWASSSDLIINDSSTWTDSDTSSPRSSSSSSSSPISSSSRTSSLGASKGSNYNLSSSSSSSSRSTSNSAIPLARQCFQCQGLPDPVPLPSVTLEGGDRSNAILHPSSDNHYQPHPGHLAHSDWPLSRWQVALSLLLRALFLALIFSPLLLLGPLLLLLHHLLPDAPAGKAQGNGGQKPAREAPSNEDSSELAVSDEPAPAGEPSLKQRCRDAIHQLLLFALRRGGAAFIKWGQWASTREDLLPPSLCLVLGALQDQAPTHSFAHTRRAVQKYLGCRLEELFTEFEREPLASGSIAQVHRARVRGACRHVPEWVVVKVRHPRVGLRIKQDFEVMAGVAAVVDCVPGLKWIRLQDSLEQFSHTMREQADLRVEAYHAHRLYLDFYPVRERVVIAQVLPHLVSEGVIVESFERGEALHRFLHSNNSLNTQIAAVGVDAYLKMLLQDNHIHLDLHPGNILARMAAAPSAGAVGEGGLQLGRLQQEGLQAGAVQQVGQLQESALQQERQQQQQGSAVQQGGQQGSAVQLVILDYGLMEDLTAHVRTNFLCFIASIMSSNAKQATHYLLRFAAPFPQRCTNRDALEADMRELFARDCQLHRQCMDLNDVLKKVLRICWVHHVTVHSSYASLLIAMCILVGFGQTLDPELSILDAAAPCFFLYNLTGRIIGRIYG